MPRVLHVIDHNGLGGAQRLVSDILRYRPQDQFFPLRLKQPSLFIPNPNSSNALSRSQLNFFYALRQLYGYLQSGKFQILHCHLQASWLAGLLLRNTCAKKGIPTLFHEHNPYIAHTSLYKNLVRSAAKRGRMIAVSPYIQNELITVGVPENNIFLLPNFVDPTKFKPCQSKSSDLVQKNPSKIILGFAGRLNPQKGWQFAFQALKQLTSRPVELWVAGEGADEIKARHWVAQQELEEQIKFLGMVKDMPAFYQAIDVLIHPVVEEPFGLVPIEAQACQVPVVAFAFRGSEYLFQPGSAMLCPLGDSVALANAVENILDDPQVRQSLIQRGTQNAQRFSSTAFFQRLEKIYQQVLSEIESETA